MRRVILRSTRVSSSTLIGTAPRPIVLLLLVAPSTALKATLRRPPPGLNALWFIQKNDIIAIQERADGSASIAMFRGRGRRAAFRPGGAAAGHAAFGAGTLHPAARRGPRHKADDAHDTQRGPDRRRRR